MNLSHSSTLMSQIMCLTPQLYVHQVYGYIHSILHPITLYNVYFTMTVESNDPVNNLVPD